MPKADENAVTRGPCSPSCRPSPRVAAWSGTGDTPGTASPIAPLYYTTPPLYLFLISTCATRAACAKCWGTTVFDSTAIVGHPVPPVAVAEAFCVGIGAFVCRQAEVNLQQIGGRDALFAINDALANLPCG